MPVRWGTRIGEFKPVGFLIGFALCFVAFWLIYHRLPFATVQVEQASQAATLRQVEELNARVKSDEQAIADLQKKMKCLQSVLAQKQKRGTTFPAMKCE